MIIIADEILIEPITEDILKLKNWIIDNSTYLGKLYGTKDYYSLNPEFVQPFKHKTDWYYPNNFQYTVKFYFWSDGDEEYKGMQYWTHDTFFWEWTTIEDFHNIIHGKSKVLDLDLEIKQWEGWNVDKVKKPKELKGVKMNKSYKGSENRVQIYIKNDDVWIQDLGFAVYGYDMYDKNNDIIKSGYYNTRAWIKISNLLKYLETSNQFEIKQILESKLIEEVKKKDHSTGGFAAEDTNTLGSKIDRLLNELCK